MYDFTVLILKDAYASSVAVTRDMLASAELLASRSGSAAPRWRLCSMTGGSVALSGGMSVATSKLPDASLPDTSLWIIPGLGLTNAEAIEARLKAHDARAMMKSLASHVAQGGQIAASCSSVFLLQAAGLLQQRRVTTTWWLAGLLARMAPDTRVDADRMLCTDGPIITAGAAFAQMDLNLYLLGERCGPQLRDHLSRIMLADGRPSQTPYIIPEMLAAGDDLVAKVVARIEAALPSLPSVTMLAQELCMSERTLSRHIHRATGKTTLALIQSVRLRRARALLQHSRMTIEQVAEAVGYRDATPLRRLMKKMTGVAPNHYRPVVAKQGAG